MLAVEALEAAYGVSRVLFGVTFRVDAGEVVTLLGRNGMGKTTTVRAIMGILRPKSGTVRFDGRMLAGLPSYRVARAGLGLVPEGRQIFPNLTVRENLVATAANRGARPDPWTLAKVFALFPRLAERKRNGCAELSGGEQQMLAIGRALLGNPSLLIMDEPSEGLAPAVIDTLIDTVKKLEEDGLAILLIEQKLDVATSIANRQLVMVGGEIALETTAAELANDSEMQRRFLGVEPVAHA